MHSDMHAHLCLTICSQAWLTKVAQVSGTVIKVPIPKVTQEVRQKMTKIAASQAESAKVTTPSWHSLMLLALFHRKTERQSCE
jgi:hypothetical protein